jgi:membrane fusion protein, multidrug efflux system
MSRRFIVIPILVLGLAAGLLLMINGCWTSWEGDKAEQRTDDAFVRADMTPMSTRISGTVKKVDVEDYQAVQPGQTLVELDDSDYSAILAEAEAALAGAEAELEGNQAAKRIQDVKIENAKTVITQPMAAVATAKAGVDAVQPDVTRTELERRRQEALFASRAATHQALEQAVADATRFSSLLTSRQGDLQRAEAGLESSRTLLEAEKRQRAALDTRDGLYRGQRAGKASRYRCGQGKSGLYEDHRALGGSGWGAPRAGRAVGLAGDTGHRPGERRCLDSSELQGNPTY